MSKSQRSTRLKDRNNEIVQHEFHDDNILPSADELQRLEGVKPGITKWIMERSEKEQDFRHSAFNDRTGVIKDNIKKEFIINLLGLIFCFFILAGGLYGGFELIMKGRDVAGSLFVGGDIAVAAGLLYNYNKRMTSKSS